MDLGSRDLLQDAVSALVPTLLLSSAAKAHPTGNLTSGHKSLLLQDAAKILSSVGTEQASLVVALATEETKAIMSGGNFDNHDGMVVTMCAAVVYMLADRPETSLTLRIAAKVLLDRVMDPRGLPMSKLVAGGMCIAEACNQLHDKNEGKKNNS